MFSGLNFDTFLRHFLQILISQLHEKQCILFLFKNKFKSQVEKMPILSINTGAVNDKADYWTVDETVFIGPSLCSEWRMSVAGTECWFSYYS